MSFWDVILDFGLMSALILVGQLLRAKVKLNKIAARWPAKAVA